MRRGITQLLRLIALVGIALVWAGRPLAAQETASESMQPAEESAEDEGWEPSFHLHGFGSVAAGKTDGNHYMVGAEKNEVEHSSFALNIAAEPIQNLKIRAQVEWQTDDLKSEVERDYAFAEWWFSKALRLRLGEAQQPFGLYTEIFDVGTVRPFVELPQGLYGPAGFAAESFRGAGITGNVPGPGGWALAYDLYGGGLDLKEDDPFGFVEEEDDEEEEEDGEEEEQESVRNMVGGRFSFIAPDDRLSFGVSAYRGNNVDDGVRRDAWIGHVQFLSDKLWVRAEAGRQREKEDSAETGYLEAAYFLSTKWQAAARYDRQDTKDSEFPDALPSLLKHREWALGLNYWFSSGLVVKASFHNVEGNRFARPEDFEVLRGQLEDGTLERKTNLFALSAQFSF